MKKPISALLALTLLLGLRVPVLAAEPVFTDVADGQWYASYVRRAAELGLVSGTGVGQFSPGSQVSCVQFAVMLCALAYPGETETVIVPPEAPWWYAYCRTAEVHGLFRSTPMDNAAELEARSGQPILREHMAQMLSNLLEDLDCPMPGEDQLAQAWERIADFESISPDNARAVQLCYALGLLTGSGSGNFTPQGAMDRAQAAVVLCAVYDAVRAASTPEDPGGRPQGAVGGQYDTAAYTVPADTDKDGWITEAEVQAVLVQLRKEYPAGTVWTSTTTYPGLYAAQGIEGGLGPSFACDGFANLVSDRIFGNLPAYTVPLEDLRVGDKMIRNTVYHVDICIATDHQFQGQTDPTLYRTVDGNWNGRVVWDSVFSYDEWPARVAGTQILSRYPAE